MSYASEDAEAASRIAAALRAAGLEVWFDQSELRGGDVWDQKIRREIHDCALFVPIISANTAARQEGYFRLEWDLADQRTHMMARDRAFIVPVCLDATPGAGTDVPESFHRVHWTRLPAGETLPAFVERVRRLLSPSPSHGSTTTALPADPVSTATPPIRERVSASWRSKHVLPVIVAVVALAAVAYFAIDKFSVSKHPASPPTSPGVATSVAPPTFSPPPHSIAVLPFVNMSGDQEQEYFSDGLSEELLNSLSRINELQVAARTSSFYFKGKDADLATIAHKLNVASVLEGSVRRSGHTIRVTAELTNAITGFHLWSQTYDRDLSDVLKLQTDIANAVANALKVTLLGDMAEKIEVGGTRNPAAFDAYLRASKADRTAVDARALQTAINGYTEAISLDPQYALAFADRSLALHLLAGYFTKLAAIPETYEKSRLDAQKSLALAPELPQGHLALARYFESAVLDFTQASIEYERAVALGSGNARVLIGYGGFAVAMGRTNSGLAAARRAVALDPLNPKIHGGLAYTLYNARSYKESVAAYLDELVLDPAAQRAFLGLPYYVLADFQQARVTCEFKDQGWPTQWCLALTYQKLGRHADAEAEVAKMKASVGDAEAYQYATIYAQWGDTLRALEWLETALRLRDSGLEYLRTDALLDPLRKEPRFQAIERALKFPS